MPLRDWYLATLGIVRYVPRGSVATPDIEEVAAAAAAPSATEGRAALRQLLAEDASPTAPASTSGSASAPMPAPPGSPAPARSPDVGLAASTAEPSEPDAESDTRPDTEQLEKEPPETEIEVRLAVWQPAPDLLVFDSLLPDSQPSIHMARLVTNIAAALGRHADSGAMPQLLDWPPARGRGENGLEAARTMVSAFCDARMSSDAVQLVLILGKDATRLLVPEEDTEAEDLPVTLRWRERDTVVATSLSSMLGDPSTKRRVWQALAPFVRPRER